MLVYLGHMTYESDGAETLSYPINIGYIKSYAINELRDLVDIKLFMHVDELCDAIRRDPPDILGLSNYVWCSSLAESIFKYSKKVNKNVITVGGGPNYPMLKENKDEYWERNSEFLDFFVVDEGEQTFCELLKLILGNRKFKKHDICIDGLDYFDTEANGVFNSQARNRIKDIENLIPSPILNGYIDPFIILMPMLQCSRGCPYRCQYCHQSLSYYNKVYHFSYERVVEEIEYIRKYKKENPYNQIYITDDNFGMFEKDTLIIDYLKKSYMDTGWPSWINAATPKKMNSRYINVALNSKGLISAAFHLQSTNDKTLKFMNRVKPSQKEIKTFMEKFAESKSNSSSNTALIIPMPYETYESHLDGLRNVVDLYEVEQCAVHTLQLFWGNAFEDQKIKEQFGMKIKYRLIAGYFGEFHELSAYEVEEVCVGTNTFSEEEYYKARLFFCFCSIFHFKRNFFYLRKYLKNKEVSLFEWLFFLYEGNWEEYKVVNDYFKWFIKMTRDELFDSREDIDAFWQNTENRKKCINGEFGFNVMQMLQGSLRLVYNEILDYVFDSTKKLLKAKNIAFGPEINEILKATKYQRLSCLSDKDIGQTIVGSYQYDLFRWAKEGFVNDLEDYLQPEEVKLAFSFPDKQREDLKAFLRLYPKDNSVAMSKFYSRLNPSLYFRQITYA
ncbi:MAG: hypothetical protein CL471_10995 [Acidobacteria bacterium]|nr:hypothetical protein [Acidobacteriota bacterium]